MVPQELSRFLFLVIYIFSTVLSVGLLSTQVGDGAEPLGGSYCTSALLAHSSSLSQINIGDEILSMCRSLYPTKYKLNPQVRVCVSSSLHTNGTDSVFRVKKESAKMLKTLLPL